MALDKQKILSDLGNVVNQLQSADCGCMGKLFSNSGQGQGMGAGGYRCQHSCCHNQNHGHQYSGASYPAHKQAMPCTPCMGMSCNPPKLYNETYGYLNQNLMQPVIREVYEDLKSIRPENTVMNNPMGNQLGLAQCPPKTPLVRGNMGEIVGQTPMGEGIGGQNAMQSMGGMTPHNAMNPMSMGGQQQQQNPMGEMGAEIVKMMMSSNKSQPLNMTGQNGQQPNQSGAINAPMGSSQNQYGSNAEVAGANAVQYSSGYNNMGANQGQFNGGNIQSNHVQYSRENMGMAMSQNNAVPQVQNPTAQYMAQQNMYAGGSSQINTMPNIAGNTNRNAQMGNMNANPGGQHIPAAQQGNYGQHSQGMAKFNEMFPGVTQGMGGNLDFDPMSIAIQMNPANQKQATMSAIQKLMSSNSTSNKPLDRNSVEMQPVMNGINAVNTNFTPNQATPNNQMQTASPSQAMNQQQFASSPETVTSQPHQMQPQVVYTAGTDELANQDGLQQQKPPGMVEMPQGGYPNQLPVRKQVIKEPVYPVDTSRYHSATHVHKYEYNTLGQPIEPLPLRGYRHMEPSLPQTLSPQPVPQKLRNSVQPKYLVKNTVSKTSLFGNKPIGKTPSRKQLQYVYNTYKGSVSNTKQSVRAPQQLTASDGRLHVNQDPSPVRQVPVERVGGDTIANNQSIDNQVTHKVDNYIDEVLDAAANQPHGDGRPEKPVAPSKIAKCRNGLQDMVFTSYTPSSAWSFHGHNHRQPF